METDKVEVCAEVSDPEVAAIKIKETKQNSIADVTTLDIKSRLSLETTTETRSEPHVNGIAQVNGICDSPQRTADIADLSLQSGTMGTSHLNQHGT
ncbi:hypothetical protein EAI_04062 [Harpegnathos saltator]|uniref:Uncharacterized protein n=1 Tax=Harpegnathos saltator TaxID=610380 RepID=E2C366_HARSA|nr:hypothetical protein EAI_04062 [Harpegnathos saltator]